MTDKPVIEVLAKHFEKLSLAERKVADYVLRNPKEAVNLIVSELAEKSGVSDATVVRMCRHVGYKGFYQFKVVLAKYVGRAEKEIIPQETPDAFTHILERYAASIIALGEQVDKAMMLNCVNMINACSQVHILAVGNTTPLGLYMGFRLGRLGVRCTYGIAPEYSMNHVNLADENDLIIAISQSGGSKQVIQGIELGKKKGLKVIAITGYKESPVAKLADITIISNNRKEAFSYYKDYAHLKEIAIIDALLEFLTNWTTIEKKDADQPEFILSEYKY